MKYLIVLNRFNIDRNKFFKSINASLVKEEDSGYLISGNLDIKGINKKQEVNSIYELVSDWNELNFKSLKEDCLKSVKDKNAETYLIKTKFLNKIKISAKSVYKHINPYLKHDGFSVNEENPEIIIYIEFKRENKKVFYRLLYGYKKEIKVIKMDLTNFNIILENPSLVIEVSDFLRLCWIFKLPLIIVTKDKNFDKILKKAKGETKGIEYREMQLHIMGELPSNYLLVGFSKHANSNEEDLIKFFKENKSKIALVFGDDKFGLTQETREKLDYCFRLTPEAKKPLKASHALSYVLGIYAGISI